MTSEIILHHYENSPFSEKPRLMFGIKGLAWRSVIQPIIMPKPDLVPLTGGYRRIPVMQIGADIYCDTQLILAELERRHPNPPVVRGADWMANLFADRTWFQASVAVIFGEIGESYGQEFADDRTKMSGRPFDLDAMKAIAPSVRLQWRTYAAWMEDGLRSGDFLGGASPSVADVGAWMNVWWTSSSVPATTEGMLSGFARTKAWAERVRAIGHGARTEMEPSEALKIAAGAQPDAVSCEPDDPSGLRAGDLVAIQADDYGRDANEGVLVGLTADRVTIARDVSGLGKLHVHFPRVGYLVLKR